MRLFTFVVVSAGLASTAAFAAGPNPGLYEASTKVTAIKGQGMTAAQIKSILSGPPEKSRECLTAAKLAQGNWFAPTSSGDCTYTKTPFVAGRINASATCSDSGGKSTVKATGSYTATSFNMTMASSNPTGSMTMVSTARRVGNCTGDE